MSRSEDYQNRSDYNKEYYKKNNPYPIRLGDLRDKLQKQAFAEDKTMPDVIKEILNRHFDEKSLKPFTNEMVHFLLINALRGLNDEQRQTLIKSLQARVIV